MARIRSLKPEFWANERLSELSEPAHMVAAAILSHADDFGFFNANPALVKAACFPLRELSVGIADCLEELRVIDYLRIETGSDGRRYGWIVAFEKHQRVSRPTPSRIKPLVANWHNAGAIHEQFTEDSVNPHGAFSESSMLNGNGNGNGNGKGTGNGTMHSVHCMNAGSAFAELTVDDLKDTNRLIEWQHAQASKQDPVVSQSENDRLRIISAAEQALGGAAVRNPVAVFAGILTKPQTLRITNESEGAAEKRIKKLEQSQPSGFAADLGKSLRGEA